MKHFTLINWVPTPILGGFVALWLKNYARKKYRNVIENIKTMRKKVMTFPRKKVSSNSLQYVYVHFNETNYEKYTSAHLGKRSSYRYKDRSSVCGLFTYDCISLLKHCLEHSSLFIFFYHHVDSNLWFVLMNSIREGLTADLNILWMECLTSTMLPAHCKLHFRFFFAKI